MYVAYPLDRAWLQNVGRRLHSQSQTHIDLVFRKLWGFVTDERNLRIALSRVAQNRGKRTAGIDEVTVRQLLAREGADLFVRRLRSELRSGTYRPAPVRRVFIPKHGASGKYRPLGIPTVTDRVVQAALKNILEPIFEADFFPSSYGFRPGKSAHAALEHLKLLLRTGNRSKNAPRRPPYQWAIEGDIKGCFDAISHHGLMVRVRRRIGDPKVNRLVVAFLKAGILSNEQFISTEEGTPQGAILSPLLANIALGVLDERYERYVYPRRGGMRTLTRWNEIRIRAEAMRRRDRARGHTICFPVRYADDFVVLVGVPEGPDEMERGHRAAEEEKAAIARLLKEKLNLDLSPEKTLVTPVTRPLRFLGHHVLVGPHSSLGHLVSRTTIPKKQSVGLRRMMKRLFHRSTTDESLSRQIGGLNPILRGWANYYRHANGAKQVFHAMDNYIWWTIYRWLRKKHKRVSLATLKKLYGCRLGKSTSVRWSDGPYTVFAMEKVNVTPFKMGWLKIPDFARESLESPVRNERRTPGSEGGAQKPIGAS